jgi:hypothetical protein
LGVLFGTPDQSFYGNEIIALAGSGTGAVQRELDRLEKSGLVTVKRVGKQSTIKPMHPPRSTRKFARWS